MNLFVITGNLVKDCRNGTTPNGKQVCNFTVANTVGFGDKEHTEFIECAVWGKAAEGKLPEYLTKGKKVLVRGEAKISSREHEGKTYSNMSIQFAQVELLGDSNAAQSGEQNEQQAPQQQQAAPAQQAPAAAPSAYDEFDDDVPF